MLSAKCQPFCSGLSVLNALSVLCLWHATTLQWCHIRSWHLKSLAKQMFIQQLVQFNNKGSNIRIQHYWPSVNGIHQWLVDSPHKGPVMQNMLLLEDATMMQNCGCENGAIMTSQEILFLNMSVTPESPSDRDPCHHIMCWMTFSTSFFEVHKINLHIVNTYCD